MNGPNRLKVMTSYEAIEERIKFIKSILKKLI